MRLGIRLLNSILVFPTFLIFLILTSIYFQLLNYDFLTQTFVKHNFYQEVPEFLDYSLSFNDLGLDEQEVDAYKKFARLLTPEILQKTIETDLLRFINFLKGSNVQLQIYLPARELGLDSRLLKDNELDISAFANADIMQRVNTLRGVTTYVLIVWVVVLIILINILYRQFQSGGRDKITGFAALLLVLGVFTSMAAKLLELFAGSVVVSLTTGKEPSQRLLGLFFKPVSQDIFKLWFIIAGIVFMIGLVLIVGRIIKSKLSWSKNTRKVVI